MQDTSLNWCVFIIIYIMYINKNENKTYLCEACADHVCNEECGCELSKNALFSIENDKKNKSKWEKNFLNFLIQINSSSNIERIWLSNNYLNISFYETIKIMQEELYFFNAELIEISSNKLTFIYSSKATASIIKKRIESIINKK